MNQCPHCNAQVRPNSRFCGKCGNSLPLASPQSSSGTLVSPKPVLPQGSSASVKTQHFSSDAPKLEVGWPGGRKETHPLRLGTIQVGRKPGNDIVLDFPTVSSKHLLLDVTVQGIQLSDLNSTNGTQVKGHKIPPNRPYPIQLGDMIRIGDLQGNSLSLVLKPASGASLQTRPLGMQQLAQKSQVVIGRDPSCDIHLDHPAVSRRHAELVEDGGRGNFVLRDLGSFNGTFLNGQRIAGQVSLAAGAVIQIGPYKLAYDGQQQSLHQTISRGHTLDAMRLELDVGIDRLILNDISLSVQAGEFVALVGGSGAGKSTLMKAMNGFNQATGGQMLIDSTDLYANLGIYRPSMAYVPQDDIIHKELPVHRALWYAAKLRLPDATPSYIEERIRDVLKKVDLTRHAEKPVHVLSGGQRKRVSIAVELLSEPVLLFLDEPASGLDPGLEKQLMSDLRRLADEGRTVVLVTHATGNIRQCDHVAFLVQGKLAYYGPPDEAQRFFDAQGFADIYTKLEREVEATGPAEQVLQPYYRPQSQPTVKGKGMMEGMLWSEHYHRSPIYQKYVLSRQQQVQRSAGGGGNASTAGIRKGSIFGQMLLLARRHFELIRNDRRTLFTWLFMVPLIMLLFVGVSDSNVFTGRELTDDEIAEAQFDPQEEELNEAASNFFDVDQFDDLDEQQQEEATALARLGNVLDLELKQDLLLGEQENIEEEDDKLSQEEIEEFDESELTEKLEEATPGIKATYTPGPTATTLIAILVLAITQAGTFGAAYEIIKEKAIYERERAINLRVLAYVLSKVVVLSSFAMIQVASALIIFGIPISLDVLPVFESLPHAGLEIFVTLLLGMLASIMLGLFISAAVPRQDVVLYVILVQLFAQMILSGPLLPLPSDIPSKAVISHWTTEGIASTIDIRQLNEKTRACTVIEVPQLPELPAEGAGGEGTPQPPPNAQEFEPVPCKWAPLKDKDLNLSYEHKAEDLQLMWAVLFGQALLWGGLTVFVQWRKK